MALLSNIFGGEVFGDFGYLLLSFVVKWPPVFMSGYVKRGMLFVELDCVLILGEGWFPSNSSSLTYSSSSSLGSTIFCAFGLFYILFVKL